MAVVRDLVVDCKAPAALARFWAMALDGYEVAPYDEDAMADLAALGVSDPEDDPSVLVQPTSGTGLRFFLQPSSREQEDEEPFAQRPRGAGFGR